jgi:hypothetical protein
MMHEEKLGWKKRAFDKLRKPGSVSFLALLARFRLNTRHPRPRTL